MSTIVDGIAETFELSATRSALSKERVVNEFARITQYVTWPILFLLFHLFFNIRIRGREIFHNAQKPFVIVVNHISFYDSFLFRLVLGPITPHLPLRFMAVTKFESKAINFMVSIGVVDFIYSLFGVFTVIPGLGIEKNIEKAKEIVRIGGNIVIYPEGRVSHSGEVEPFKKGAATLRQATNVSVIPVSFRFVGRGLLRKKIQINIGEKLVISDGESVDRVTDIFYEAVKGLYEIR